MPLFGNSRLVNNLVVGFGRSDDASTGSVNGKGIDMRMARLVRGLAAVLGAVVGLSLLTAGPVSAREFPNYPAGWRAYGNTNPVHSSPSPSSWHCGSTKAVAADVVAQGCVIGDQEFFNSIVQGAVIVRNNRSGTYQVSAGMQLVDLHTDPIGSWTCATSGVASNSWSVCYGERIYIGTRHASTRGWVRAAGRVALDPSPTI